jgi:hypothetical protein
MHFGVAHGTLFQNPKTHIFEGKRVSVRDQMKTT